MSCSTPLRTSNQFHSRSLNLSPPPPPFSLPAMSPYLSSRTDCGNRDDVVSYGKSSANICKIPMNTEDTSKGLPFIAELYPYTHIDEKKPSTVWAMDHDMNDNGHCNDRGNSRHLVGTCEFGTDSNDCGHRLLTLPRSTIPDGDPDNSCTTANNGLCEDQLFYSIVAPNDIKLNHHGACLPNTE